MSLLLSQIEFDRCASVKRPADRPPRIKRECSSSTEHAPALNRRELCPVLWGTARPSSCTYRGWWLPCGERPGKGNPMLLRPYARMILIGFASLAAGVAAGRLAIAAVNAANSAPARAAEATPAAAPVAVAVAAPVATPVIAAPAASTPAAAAPVAATVPTPVEVPKKTRIGDERKPGKVRLDAVDANVSASLDPNGRRLRLRTPFGKFEINLLD